MEEKEKKTIKIRHRSRIGRVSNYLQHKRFLPFNKVKNKFKIKNWKKQMEKMEKNVDYDIVKDNFKHFYHLNLEDSVFDKELGNLEHIFTPIIFWFLINESYFEKDSMKERIDNLIKELSLNNYNTSDDILVLREESDINENIADSGYKKSNKNCSFISQPLDTKIKSDFFAQIKSLIKYIKDENKNDNNENKEKINDSLNINKLKNEDNNNEKQNNNVGNENDINFDNIDNKDIKDIINIENSEKIIEDKNNNIDNNKENNLDNNISQLEKDKVLINNLIKRIHKINENKLKKINEFVPNEIEKKIIENKYNNNEKANAEINNNEKIKNYIKTNPLFEQDNESLTRFNKFIGYIRCKEEIKSQIFEKSDKIFSFSEKFINLNKADNINKNIEGENKYEKTYIKDKVIIKEENNILANQGICCICNNGDVEQNQFLLKCEQCCVTVHQNCYGSKELYNWVCDACKEMTKEEVYNLECFLCPVHGGAFKKIELPIESTFYNNIMDYKHNKKELPKNNYNIIIPKKDYDKTSFAWAHLSCALWNSNINLKNYERKTGISLKNISYEDFHSYCSLCKKDNCGPTIKCNNDSCDLSFHPECARINNCCLEVEIINKEYQYNVYCYKHRPNLLAKKINLNCQNEIQQIILANQELNNIYELYKKVYKNDLYQREKILNQIEIFTENSQSLKKHRNHKNKVNISLNKRYKNSKNLENIVIKLSKRGRKRKDIINNYFNNSANNLKYLSKKKTIRKIINKSKKLKTIKIENFNFENPNLINASTIINNIGNGNNINIYVNNYNHVLNCGIASTKRKTEIKKNNKNNLQSSFLSPTIEINKKEFDKFDNSKKAKFEVEKYIEDKNEFIIFLIGFLNDYTLNNRIIIKKNSKNIHLIDNTKCPLQYLKYDDFLNNDIPWDEIGYKNLSSSILRKSFFAIIPDEKKFKKLFLDKIEKTLKELKKNKKFEKYTIECDNKENCIGIKNGVYNLLSLDSFRYKILDEKHIFPIKFICQSCINNIPNENYISNNNSKGRKKKNIINISK